MYATTFEKDPSTLPYVPAGLRTDDAAFLRRIGWETVQDYRAGR